MSTEHYKQASVTVEPIVLCRAFPFCFGNVLKYILRAPYKGDAIGDYSKAIDYLEMVLTSDEYLKVGEVIASNSTIRCLMRSWPDEHVRSISTWAGYYDLEKLRDALHKHVARLREEAANE